MVLRKNQNRYEGLMTIILYKFVVRLYCTVRRDEKNGSLPGADPFSNNHIMDLLL